MSAPGAQTSPQGVPIRDSDGEIRVYPGKDVQQAIAAGGEVATTEEVHHEKLQAEYGGVGGQLASFGAGAASGLSFGGSDALIAGMGGREALKNYSEANPNARTAGEVGGIGASLLIPGLGEAEGASLLARGAKAATALPRLVSGAGRVAERGIAGILEREGAGLAERAAVKGLSSAAGGAVEGAAYGAAHEISDAAMEDHELTAEKLLAGAKHGALWGAGAGGLMGASGELLSGASEGLAGAMARHVGGEGKSISEALDNQSGELAFRAAGGGKAVAKAADKFGEGYAAVGKVWRDDAPSLVGKGAFSELTREDLRQAAGKGMTREGKALGEDLGRMTAAGQKAGTLPTAMGVVADIEDVARKIGMRAGAEPAVAKLEAFAASIKRITGIADESGALLPQAGTKQLTYEELRNFRVDADNMWRGASKDPTLTGSTKFFGDVRDSLEQRVLAGAEEAGVKTSYLAAKNKYQAFSLLNRATEGGVAAEGSNRFFSLTDNLATHAGAVVGGTIGGPLGAAIGAGLGGVASRAVRTRGDFVAADLLQRVSQMGNIERVSAKVDNQITEGVRAFLTGTKSATRAAAERTTRPAQHEALAQSQRVLETVGNPALIERKTHAFVGNVGTVAPNVTAAIASKVANSYTYLGTKMPKLPTDPTSLTPQFTRPRASDTELARAAKVLEGRMDPLSILDDMKHGELSREKVDTLRATSPRLFQQIREEIVKQAPELKQELSYAQKIQLEILMDVATDGSLTRPFIAAMQATKQATPDKPQTAAPKGGGRRPIKMDTDIYSTTSQASSK